jgi:hypothetical protein
MWSAVALVAEHLGEALLELLAGERGERLELFGNGRSAGVAIDERLGRLDENLRGGLAGVEGDELDLRALVGGEFQVHRFKLNSGAAGVSIDLW